jgi:hypothetical protein
MLLPQQLQRQCQRTSMRSQKKGLAETAPARAFLLFGLSSMADKDNNRTLVGRNSTLRQRLRLRQLRLQQLRHSMRDDALCG